MNKKTEKIRQLLGWTAATLLVLLILLFIGAAIPQVGNYKVMTVLTGSMEPAIKTGTVLVITPKEDYGIDDIVTFSIDGSVPTTHRIVEKTVENGNISYTTKGDANPAQDMTEVRKEDVVGKVAFGIPFLGYVIEFVKTPIGFVLLVIFPALIIVGGEVKKIYNQLKQ